MTTSAPAAPPQTGRHQRSVKNYLIDSKFQLKYTAYILLMALVISLVLGVFLVRTSNKVVDESKKVSDVVKMSIKDDPIYGDNPELMKSFTDSSSETDNLILAQQRNMLLSVVGGLSALVILIGIMGIYFTHKVAGPIYKMRGLLKQVGEGKLNFRYGKLRKGDELQEFFETFNVMVDSLKERQAKEIELLEAGITAAKGAGATDESLEKIVVVRDEMKRALDV